MKTTETYTSSSATHVKFDLYVPNVILRYKGIVQIHHGMGEYSDWYQKFAEFISNDGYIVVVSDFPGHGTSLNNFEQGYFGYGDSIETLVEDMQRLRNIISSRYPELPYFMIGNQFGSLVLRKYMASYGDFIQGAILIGTAGPRHGLFLAKLLIELDILFKGNMHHSRTMRRFVHDFWIKGFSKRNYKTQDQTQLKKYIDDPMTDFIYTNQAYLDILKYLKGVNEIEEIDKIPTYLSIFIISGKKDAFGKKGKGPLWLYKHLKQKHIKDLTYHLYESDYQDILHEVNRKEVYHDVLQWLNQRTYI